MEKIFGKKQVFCKGGSLHLADLSKGNFGANGIGGLGIATGAGLSIKLQ